MEDFGFVKVAAAIPEVKVADCKFNAGQIINLIVKASEQGVRIICFPELCVTGYTCGDLFFQQTLINKASDAVRFILETVKQLDITFIIGAPVEHCGKLFNTAIVGYKGKILGYVPKTFLPNYNEFYEKRWFVPSFEATTDHIGEVPFGTNILFGEGSRRFAVEICEDLWSAIPPGSIHAQQGAQIIFNLSASNELTGKHSYRKSLVEQQSARCIAGYVYVSAGWGESTTDMVFSGNTFIYENGRILAESERFLFEEQLIISEIDVEQLNADRLKNSTFGINKAPGDPYRLQQAGMFSGVELPLTRKINPLPFVSLGESGNEQCKEVFSIQVGGLAKRMLHTGTKKLVIGVSGGLDSTLALLVCVKTVDKLNIPRDHIVGITMPGFGTTGRTYQNAIRLMQSLGITIREIDITQACLQHFNDIGHDPSMLDVTYENTQARERTQILMDVANQVNGLVVGTGDMSELALGWATYNGDHMSMYAVNTSIPKTLVRALVRWVANTQMDADSANTLIDIVDTPVSPELLPAADDGKIVQITEDIIGPYELHDFFLYYMVRFGFSPEKIKFLAGYAFKDTYSIDVIVKWLKVFIKRFFNQQFKRSCLPDGPKVGSVSLSPRADWRMPSDASASCWFEEI